MLTSPVPLRARARAHASRPTGLPTVLVSGEDAAAQLRREVAALDGRAGLLALPEESAAGVAAVARDLGLQDAGPASLMSAGLDCAYAEAPSAGVERACDDAALAEVAELVAAAFGVAADAALPEPLQDVAGADAWLLRAPDGRALSAVVATVDPDLLALWSAATPPPARRRGHAARLLRAVLGHYACEGVPTACVVATADGEPLYRSLGFAPAEPLRLWMKR